MKENVICGNPSQMQAKIATLGQRLVVAGVFIATMGLGFGAPIGRLEWAGSSAITWERKTTPAWASFRNSLGGSKAGRVILHTVCLIRRPDRASWHWRGILREFAG